MFKNNIFLIYHFPITLQVERGKEMVPTGNLQGAYLFHSALESIDDGDSRRLKKTSGHTKCQSRELQS